MLDAFIQNHPQLLLALRNTCRSSTRKQVSFLKDPEMCSPLKARGMLLYQIPDEILKLNAAQFPILDIQKANKEYGASFRQWNEPTWASIQSPFKTSMLTSTSIKLSTFQLCSPHQFYSHKGMTLRTAITCKTFYFKENSSKKRTCHIPFIKHVIHLFAGI